MKLNVPNLALAVGLTALLSSSGLCFAAKDTLVVTGLTDSRGFTPTTNGNPSEYFYATTIPAGTSLADTIPIQFDAYNNPNTQSGESYTVTLNATGQIANAITFDASTFQITDTSTGVLKNAFINTTNLSPGDYAANIQVQATPPSGIDISHNTLHLRVHVVPAAPAKPTCFLTDSSGLKLSDCSGIAVDSNGEFLVVSNNRKITSTNPGQFYYNLVWTNDTNSPVTFTSLGLQGTNVLSAGTNSVHVLIYNASGFTANFDDVNTTGVPCGQPGGTCKSPITVPAGQTLWLTWHVSYQWVGSALWADIPPAGAAGCGLTSVHGTIAMSALLQNADASVVLGCSGSANGQNIK